MGREMGHRSWEAGVARERGGPGGGHVENHLPMGTPHGLINYTIGKISAQRKVSPFWRAVGALRDVTRGGGGSSVDALGGSMA